MRKVLHKFLAKTFESEPPQFFPQVGLNTILISDLEVVIERRARPCTKIEIPLKFCKDCVLVSVPFSVVPVPNRLVLHSLWVPVLVNVVPVPLLYCMWVPVPAIVVLEPLPPQLPHFTLELPRASRQRL